MQRPGLWVLAPLSLAVGIGLNVAGVISAQTLDYISMYAVLWVLWRLLAAAGLFELVAFVAAVAGVCGLIWAQAINPDIRYMPYLLVVPANLLAAWIFSRGLVSGRSAILVDLIEIMGLRPLEPRFQRFVEGQCLLWSIMSLALAVVALLAMVWAAQREALSVVLSGLVIAQILWFAVSHYYAAYRYGRPETWPLTLRTMTRPDVWARLGVR